MKTCPDVLLPYTIIYNIIKVSYVFNRSKSHTNQNVMNDANFMGSIVHTHCLLTWAI